MANPNYLSGQPSSIHSDRFSNRVNHIALLILMTITLLSTSTQVSAEKLVINSGIADPYITSDGRGFYTEIAAEAFSRINIETEVILVSPGRSLINANQGIEDGNIGHIRGMEINFPNLIRVPEEIMEWEFIAFVREVNFKVDGWSSLKPYEVGFITGWKIYERNITDAIHITKLKSDEQLFNMLNRNRIEVGMHERWGGSWWIKELGFDIETLEPPVKIMPMYLYLHKKHAALVPKVNQALIEMKKDGSYQKIYDRNLSYLLD